MKALGKMTPRERMLAGIVAGAVFLFLNIILLSGFLKKQAAARIELTNKNQEWNAMKILFSESDLWAKRDAWIQKNQPRLTSEGTAGVQLLDFVKTIAKKNEVSLENPAIGNTAKTAFYRSAPVNIETKSSWAALIKFLHAMQQPDQFIVFETANIAIDPNDPSMMRGKFRIARWYAL